jgi:hypothetical protein
VFSGSVLSVGEQRAGRNASNYSGYPCPKEMWSLLLSHGGGMLY